MIINIGYACLNTTLRTKFRDVTLKTLEKLNLEEKIQKLNSLSLNNISQVDEILEFNFKNNILLYRIPTNLLPFPTHPISEGWNWREILKPCLEFTGKLAKQYGIRISFHADDYTIINSHNDLVYENSKNSLVYLADVIDLMKLKSNIVVHIGGTFKDKITAILRFISNFKKLPVHVQEKIVIENDDKQYDWEDTLVIAKNLKVPMVLDIHHYKVCNFHSKINKNGIYSIFETWHDKKPKIHLSSPQGDKSPAAHADYINVNDFLWFYELSKDFDYDVMLEAKAKELAAIKFREDLNDISIMI